jgi:hypothetical protein
VRKFRYTALNPAAIESRALVESGALSLLVFLTDHQTDAAGWVYYGREFGYAWIRSNWLAAPSERTLQRHMAILKKLGEVEVRREFHGGIRVRLLKSAKFAKAIPPPAVQLPMFGSKVTPIRPVEKPVEKQWESSGYPNSNTATDGGIAPPRMAAERIKK